MIRLSDHLSQPFGPLAPTYCAMTRRRNSAPCVLNTHSLASMSCREYWIKKRSREVVILASAMRVLWALLWAARRAARQEAGNARGSVKAVSEANRHYCYPYEVHRYQVEWRWRTSVYGWLPKSCTLRCWSDLLYLWSYYSKIHLSCRVQAIHKVRQRVVLPV